MNRQRNMLLKYLERLPNSVAGNASTNGIKLGDKLVHLTTGSLREQSRPEPRCASLSRSSGSVRISLRSYGVRR